MGNKSSKSKNKNTDILSTYEQEHYLQIDYVNNKNLILENEITRQKAFELKNQKTQEMMKNIEFLEMAVNCNNIRAVKHIMMTNTIIFCIICYRSKILYKYIINNFNDFEDSMDRYIFEKLLNLTISNNKINKTTDKFVNIIDKFMKSKFCTDHDKENVKSHLFTSDKSVKSVWSTELYQKIINIFGKDCFVNCIELAEKQVNIELVEKQSGVNIDKHTYENIILVALFLIKHQYATSEIINDYVKYFLIKISILINEIRKTSDEKNIYDEYFSVLEKNITLSVLKYTDKYKRHILFEPYIKIVPQSIIMKILYDQHFDLIYLKHKVSYVTNGSIKIEQIVYKDLLKNGYNIDDLTTKSLLTDIYKMSLESDSNKICNICYLNYPDITLICSHEICTNCTNGIRNNLCPFCRKELIVI